MSRQLLRGISTAGRISKSLHQYKWGMHLRGAGDGKPISKRTLHLLEAKSGRQYLANLPADVPRWKCILVRSEGGARLCRLVSSDDGFNGEEASRYRAHN